VATGADGIGERVERQKALVIRALSVVSIRDIPAVNKAGKTRII